MLTRLRNALAGLAAVALAVAAAPHAARAAPALWVIKDADSTIYLFGSVHVLKSTTVWKTDKVAKALADSADVTFEIDPSADPASQQPLIASLGLDPAHPLQGKISPADYQRLTVQADAAGLPMQAIGMMRPWLAAVTMTLAPLQKAGYDPLSGVELKLAAEAKAAGKPVKGFETTEQQLHYLADLPEAEQIAMLRSNLDDAEKGAAELDSLVADWEAGDQTALTHHLIDDMKTQYPVLYEKLIAGRNRAFADDLKARLAGSGVSFVALGAGHFVGPDGVLTELAKRGIKAERIE
jgi:uncharacterized protein YbaP (TraB family)